MTNPFFKNIGPFNIEKLLNKTNTENKKNFKKDKIYNVSDLAAATKKDLTFFHSKNYSFLASKTKASYCVTIDSLSHFLPNSCKKIIVKNVLLAISKITKEFYPKSIVDDFDESVKDISKTSFKKKVKYGKNVLIGKNVKIGKNCLIVKDNVNILDGCIIGKKGFGFFPNHEKNIRYPHIGIVIINEDCEIGCGSTIDRGSLSNTIIGKNTYLDNQVHIAHNNKIGDNCIIAGQVGFAGSSSLGNNVMIGGQSGISGHLKIGNNVHVGGGSGVISDISDNTKVMGYPAKNLREFLKNNR